MRTTIILCALGFAVALLSGCGEEETLLVENAWVKPNAPSEKMTSAYLVIQNHTPSDQTLVSAESDVAAHVGLYNMQIMEDEMLQPVAVEHILVPALGTATLGPDSHHLQLHDLQRDLKPGDTVTLTLHFENNVTRTAKATVQTSAQPSGTAEGI